MLPWPSYRRACELAGSVFPVSEALILRSPQARHWPQDGPRHRFQPRRLTQSLRGAAVPLRIVKRGPIALLDYPRDRPGNPR